MNKFKVGDTVRRTVTSSWSLNKGMKEGDEDTVKRIDSFGNIDLEKYGDGHSQDSFKLVHEFQQGDEVQVRDINSFIDEWGDAIYLANINDKHYTIDAYNEDIVCSWDEIRHKPKTKTVTIENVDTGKTLEIGYTSGGTVTITYEESAQSRTSPE